MVGYIYVIYIYIYIYIITSHVPRAATYSAYTTASIKVLGKGTSTHLCMQGKDPSRRGMGSTRTYPSKDLSPQEACCNPAILAGATALAAYPLTLFVYNSQATTLFLAVSLADRGRDSHQ